MNGPQAAILPDGDRLHLNHGPIDLIIGVEGNERHAAYQQATERFQTILTGLVAELDGLRMDYDAQQFKDPVAQRMSAAIAPFAGSEFVTPMAAVAGAVADEVLEATIRKRRVTKAYVNNGGDIAVFLGPGQSLRGLSALGPIEITYDDPARGIATSGWRGRSHSRGIADAVTVVAETAAVADVAATLIANAVDLPGHPAIERTPARKIEVGDEMGDILVTTAVGPLTENEVHRALDRGLAYAKTCLERGLILGATLTLNAQSRVLTER